MNGLRVPEGWELKKLAEVADVKLGRQRSPKNHSGPNMRPYLRAANITWEGLDLSDVKEMHFDAKEFETFQLRPGDVLVAEASGSRSGVGKAAIWTGEIAACAYQNTLIRVRSRGPLPEFLRLVLFDAAVSGRFGEAARGVGIHHLGAKTLSEWPIVVPPTDEQQLIIEQIETHFTRLDFADKLLAKTQKRIQAFKASLLQGTRRAAAESAPEAQREVSLEDLWQEAGYGTSVKCSYEDAGVPVLRIPNIRNGRLDLSDLKNAHESEDLSKLKVRGNDLLLIRTNGSKNLIGRTAAVTVDLEMAFASYLIRLRLKPELADAQFVSALLEAPSCRRQMQELAASTSGQYNVSLSKLRMLSIPLPDINIQRGLLKDLDEKLSLAEVLLDQADVMRKRGATLRRRVLRDALSGRLATSAKAA